MTPRPLTRAETHDLGMILKDRAKVLRHHAEEQAATHMAEFERKLAAEFKFDDDSVWKEVTAKAMAVVAEAQATIAKRCEELGIPRDFAPSLHLSWQGRGQNMVESRRRELIRVAKATVEAMTKAAITKIEKQSLELRTQVISMGCLSDDAKLFLDSLATVEEAMTGIDFAQIEKQLANESTARLQYRRNYGID